MKIIGNSVGAPVPRTDYNQTDPARSDYLIGRELLEQKISAAAQAAQQAADKALPKAGGTMAGPIKMGGNKLTGLAEPLSATDAATRKYADACRDNAKDHADALSAENRQYTNTRIKAASPYNLLDNSDFSNPVNQRGETSYSKMSGYTIDRWKATDKIVVVLKNGCIELTCTSTNSANGFTQNLASPPPAGTALTLAVMENDGTLHVGSVEMPSADRVIAFSSASGLSGRVYTDRVALMVSIGKTVSIKWAALYEGEYTADTLPDYRPKGYDVELLTCRDYFRIARNGSGYVSSDGAHIFFPYHMRIAPTATLVEAGIIRTQGKQYTPTSVSEAIKYIGESIRVTLPGAYGESNNTAVLVNAKIHLSADM